MSPANKDPPAHREAFVSKCETYLQGRAGLLIVDVVTDRPGGLHGELIARIAPYSDPNAADQYAASYRPIDRDGVPSLDVWHQPLALGEALPTMPLWLSGGLCLPANLAATYERTCREQRLDRVVGPAV